ncbi:bcl-2-like protein 2 [Dendronephthya gigantea]|uniref:bcl-2-like protein 2 n=1 Tax=Dendronephthya gigantea TaxID=151771 RepID=UPI00106A4845|nr:bcl-2-like protein 2 [Dendronephthya gigantea]
MSFDSCSDCSSSDSQESPTEEYTEPFVKAFLKETRDLVVDYVGFRLRSKFKQSCLRGLPREILVPPVQPSNRANSLRSLAMNLESQHEQLFQQICFRVDLSDFEAQKNFNSISEEIFSNEVNWGRIVSLITFSGVVAHHFVEEERPEMVLEVIDWLLDIFRVHLIIWIIEKGGWDGFVNHFNGNKPPKSFWTGVLAMGAIGAAGITLLAMSK